MFFAFESDKEGEKQNQDDLEALGWQQARQPSWQAKPPSCKFSLTKAERRRINASCRPRCRVSRNSVDGIPHRARNRLPARFGSRSSGGTALSGRAHL